MVRSSTVAKRNSSGVSFSSRVDSLGVSIRDAALIRYSPRPNLRALGLRRYGSGSGACAQLLSAPLLSAPLLSAPLLSAPLLSA